MADTPSIPPFALVLFDLHGETSVVQTEKLAPQTLIKTAGRPHLNMGKQKFLVEVLDTGDQAALKLQQVQWTKSHRSLAIEKEAEKRADSTSSPDGGFLNVWPEDEQVENVRPNRPSRQKSSSKETTRQPLSNKRKNPVNQKVQAKQQTSKPAAAKKTKRTVPESSSSQFPYALEGSNGRKLSILYEGSGDYTQDAISPRRDPVHLDDLTSDERDIVTSQIDNHARGMVSKGCQTDAVVIITCDEEALAWYNRYISGMPEKTTSTAGTMTDEQPSKEQTPVQPSSPDQPIGESSVSTKPIASYDQDANNKLDQILRILQAPKGKPRPSVDIVSNYLDGLQETHNQPETDSNNQEVDEPEPVDTDQTTITNFYLPISTNPEGSSTILTLPNRPTTSVCSSSFMPAATVPVLPSQSSRTLGPCANGPVVEISSSADLQSILLDQDNEIRIQNKTMWSTKESSCSCTNFAWKLAKTVYTTDDLMGKNYRGRKGKSALSPRRKHAIEHAISDCYGPENLNQGIVAINTGIRNMNRKPKV